ncbi:MAG TPA: PEP/pyruvate-binding domain-containing protein [Elusimicrobiales bacterium]|nr:PEP/pyruvate-binding domain-containing protein [Elusimicrobiales bacterium]
MSRLLAAALLACALRVPAFSAGPPAFLPAIAGENDFRAMSGPPIGLLGRERQLLYLIDLDEGEKTYFINTGRYRDHYQFMADAFLEVALGRDFNENTLYSAAPRFLAGSIEKASTGNRYVFSVWNNKGFSRGGTDITSVAGILRRSFHLTLSGPQPPLESAKILAENTVIPGRALGVLRREGGGEKACSSDIILAKKDSVALPHAGGLIFYTAVSAASHAAVLAAGFSAPVVYREGAEVSLAPLVGKAVSLEARPDGFTLRPATEEEAAALTCEVPVKPIWLPSDLRDRRLPDLSRQRAPDSVRCGGKSANLGEAANSGVSGFSVAPGFCIPFYYYAGFIRHAGLDGRIRELLGDPRLYADGAWRAAALERLRDAFKKAALPPGLAPALLSRLRELKGTGGVYVRSSANAEDLPIFSGAGLYTTVPNVVAEDAFLEAVKAVWASVWNEAAFLARERTGIRHQSVQMGVLVQRTVSGDTSGVILTRLSDSPEKLGIFSKAGAGARVVGGGKLPELAVYDRAAKSIAVKNFSGDGVKLIHAAAGGLTESPAEPGKAVLDEKTAGALAAVGLALEDYFGGLPQDIEWTVLDGGIFLLQARTYNFSPAAPE